MQRLGRPWRVAEPGRRRSRAAGGVVWRERDGRARGAVVHRPRYDDWTLPKGKLDAGETGTGSAAVREVAEETGAGSRCTRRIGTVKLPDRRRPQEGRLLVDALPRRRVRAERRGRRDRVAARRARRARRLSYDVDQHGARRLRARPRARFGASCWCGTPGPASAASGAATTAASARRGRRGAGRASSATLLATFAPTEIFTADRSPLRADRRTAGTRCGLAVRIEPRSRDEAYADGPRRHRDALLRAGQAGPGERACAARATRSRRCIDRLGSRRAVVGHPQGRVRGC